MPTSAGLRTCARGFAASLAAAAGALLLVGCGAGNSSATSVARSYEQAILSRNGEKLCATFAPKLREVVAEQVEDEQGAAGSAASRFDCGRFYHSIAGASTTC